MCVCECVCNQCFCIFQDVLKPLVHQHQVIRTPCPFSNISYIDMDPDVALILDLKQTCK